MTNASLKKRYFFKLSTNVIGFLLNFISAALVPRGLGVTNYGNYNFTTTLITQFLMLLELRSSTCFYIKLSQRPKENGLIFYYGLVTLLLFLILSTSIICITISPLREVVFQGQHTAIIIFALILVILTWSIEFFVKAMDAQANTVSLERMRIINKVLGAVLLVLLYTSNQLTLENYFYYQYFLAFLLLLFLFKYLIQNNYLTHNTTSLSKASFLSYSKEFYHYTSPLGIYVILQFIQISCERWILQYYGGAYQQGLFSFSFSLVNFGFFVVLTMIPLFTREMSVAAGEKNITLMAKLFRQYVPVLYTITAFFCGFIFVESEAIIELFGGKEYYAANLTVKILAFYPLLSVYSNLNGAVIYANSNTRFVLRMALVFTPLIIISTYALINKGEFGCNLGAVGLAIVYVFFELCSVIIFLKFNTRFLQLNYFNYIFHMLFSMIPFMLIGFASHLFTQWLCGLLNLNSNIYVSFLLSGMLYSILALLITWIYPILFGLTHEDIHSQITSIRKALFSK